MKRGDGNVARQEMHDNIWKHWPVLNSTEACDGTKFCHFPCCPRGHSCHQISHISHVPWEMPDYTQAPSAYRNVSFYIPIHWSIIMSGSQNQVGALKEAENRKIFHRCTGVVNEDNFSLLTSFQTNGTVEREMSNPEIPFFFSSNINGQLPTWTMKV